MRALCGDAAMDTENTGGSRPTHAPNTLAFSEMEHGVEGKKKSEKPKKKTN